MTHISTILKYIEVITFVNYQLASESWFDLFVEAFESGTVVHDELLLNDSGCFEIVFCKIRFFCYTNCCQIARKKRAFITA